jgi:hypothetical protein
VPPHRWVRTYSTSQSIFAPRWSLELRLKEVDAGSRRNAGRFLEFLTSGTILGG